MLDPQTKRRIDTCRDILVGKIPDPKSQVEQITIALIYKFMDDMDLESEEMGGQRKFFTGEFERYAWARLVAPGTSGQDMLNTYSEALTRMPENPGLPTLFRDIFRNAYLPYRDPETLRGFLREINGFTYDHSERLGDAFEYLLSVLGSQGDAGQFRTPRHIIDFMVEIIAPQKNEVILDPACGTAGFLISSYKHILKANTSHANAGNGNGREDSVAERAIESPLRFKGDQLTPEDRQRLATNIKGYDISPDMVRLSLVNLYLHGFADPQVDEYDTLTSEDKWNEVADVILANPPFMSPKGGIPVHRRFAIQSKRSEVLFVDYIAEHLTPQGRAAVIVPEGIIFQSQTAYCDLRKMLVDKFLVAVVSLPAGVFNPYSGVKTSILILDRPTAKTSESIAFFKIENDGYGLGAQRRAVKGSQLGQVQAELAAWLEGVRGGRDISVDSSLGFAVEKARIAESGDYALNGERYRDAEKSRRSLHAQVPLGDVVDILDSKRRPITKHDRVSGPYPYFGATGILDHVDGYLFDEPLILLGEDGAKWGAGERSAFVIEGKTWVNNHAHVLRPKRDLILDKYLVEVLNFADLTPFITGVTVPKLNQQKMREIQIPLPPMATQREIVAEIEQYQKIIDSARTIIDNYRPHISVDQNWPMIPISEIALINPQKSELADLDGATPVSFVPMAALSENRTYFTSAETKQLSDVSVGYTYFRDNDVLIAKVTPCFENGKAAIAGELVNGIGFGSSEYYVIRAGERTLPRWIFHWLTTPNFRKRAAMQMTGTGGLQRVPRRIIEEEQVPLPILKIQRDIITDLETEEALIDCNRDLIIRFEKKIESVIAQVWSEAHLGVTG